MSNAADRLFAHVLETAPALAIRLRAQLYRDTAEVLADAQHSPHLVSIADDLDEIERRHAQLVLDFKRGKS
jgi:hypothetical protein